MSGMTLSEFLLARIAEDESTARVYPELAEALRNQGMSKAADWLTERGDHSLAECEAKRRIVKAAEAAMWDSDDSMFPDPLARDVLASLAAVYADHPDYRDEWRA